MAWARGSREPRVGLRVGPGESCREGPASLASPLGSCRQDRAGAAAPAGPAQTHGLSHIERCKCACAQD